MSSATEAPLSGGGDSGSAVVDRSGRLVGILTADAQFDGDTYPLNRLNDVLYLTPAWWLLEEAFGRSGIELELA